MTSFRPKPIDINRPLPILPEEELEDSISRCVPQLETGISAYEQQEAHLQMVLKENKRKAALIPIPSFSSIPDSKLPRLKGFKQPGQYIHFEGELKIPFTYDADSEDERFIRRINSKRGKKILSTESFEMFIELLEEITEKKRQIPSLDEKLIDRSSLTPAIAESIYLFWKERHSLGRYTPQGKRMEEFCQLRKLRLELEKARTLAEMVRRREKLKKEKVQIMMEIFKQLSKNNDPKSNESIDEVTSSPQDSKGIPKRPKASISTTKRKTKRRKLSVSHSS